MKAVRSGDPCKYKLLGFFVKRHFDKIPFVTMSYVFTAIDPETEIADVLVVCFFQPS